MAEMTSSARLQSELARLEALSAIKRLQRAFGYYLDQGAWDEAAALFASNGTLEMGLDGVYQGPARIREYLYALGAGRRGLQTGELHEYLQLQPVIHVAADASHAKGRWRSFMLTGELGKNAFWGEGPYECEYVREGGIWRISRLHAYQTFIVPYAGGWVKNRDATGGRAVGDRLQPDRPPTEQYGVWPEVYTPPFHFDRVQEPEPAEETDAADKAPPAEAPQPSDEDAAMRSLAHRIGSLRDCAQIENLLSAYGYYLDKQLWDAVTDLFAEDGTMEISQRGIYTGRRSIRRALELFGPPGIQSAHVHNHMQLQPVIHVSADRRRAWARSRAFSQLGTYEGIGIWHGGVYENEFVKEDGVWKFKKDHVYTTWFAEHARGWAHGARVAPKPSDKIPPDQPPSEIYEAFPGVYIPAFHYPHPVSGEEIPCSPQAQQARDPADIRPASGTRAPCPTYPPSPALEQLALHVQRLEDERDIEILQRTYGYLIDKCLWQAASELFAADGTLEIGGRGVFVGRQRVLEYLRWLRPAGLTRGFLFDHLQLQPIVTVAQDGRTARGRWRFFAQVGEHEKFAVWGLGTYENEYVKESGVWKIKTLHAHFRMHTPYCDGWGVSALPMTQPDKDLPPDRPPTGDPMQYPATWIPPCHYEHPVTGRWSTKSL